MISIMDEAYKIEKEAIEMMKNLHRIPEVGMRLEKTANYVEKKLIDFGYEPKRICEYGIVAMTCEKEKGTIVLLRSDMDALPIYEKAECEYKSRNNNMHACGHDFHMATILAAAKIFKNYEKELNGTIKFMFQPGEELLKGAYKMIKEGVLDNPKVDKALMFHVLPQLNLPAGTVLLPKEGYVMSASDWFEISIRGRGGHGSEPEKTVDPLNIAAHIHIALQALNSREISAFDSVSITIGQMYGGSIANVIPEEAFLRGTIRTFSEKNRDYIKNRMKEIVNGIASTFCGIAKVLYSNPCPALYVDEKVSLQVESAIKKTLPMDKQKKLGDVIPSCRLMSSEDFAYISRKVPSSIFYLSGGSDEEGCIYPLHDPRVVFNENAIVYAVASIVSATIEMLGM